MWDGETQTAGTLQAFLSSCGLSNVVTSGQPDFSGDPGNSVLEWLAPARVDCGQLFPTLLFRDVRHIGSLQSAMVSEFTPQKSANIINLDFFFPLENQLLNIQPYTTGLWAQKAHVLRVRQRGLILCYNLALEIPWQCHFCSHKGLPTSKEGV